MPMRRNKTTQIRPRKWLLSIAVCCCLAGCAVGPDYHQLETQMPDKFAPDSSSATKTSNRSNQPTLDTAKWWESLKDPELNSLIDRAIKGNQDLEIALNRIQEARTQEAVVMGDALPQAEASLGGGAGSGSDLARGRASEALVSAENSGHLQQITQVDGFDAAWEIDLFGKYRREMEAAAYNTEATIAARNGVLTSVVADVAHAYVDMRALQMQLVVLQKNEGTLQDYLKLTQERFDRGITNELDLTLAQRQLASLQSEKAPLIAQIHAAQYVIAVLLGQFPENLTKELDQPGTVPQLPDKIEAGLPLDLLRRRPDIQESEREVASATARIGIAEADLFPHVSITGGVGGEGMGAAQVANPSSFIWSVGPSVNWSLLDFGTLDALVDIADLRSKEMLAQYKQTVLNAVREVDTSLGAYSAQQDRLRHLGKALMASERAVDLSTRRYNRGLTDSLNVIDAQRQEYTLEEQYVSSQQVAAEQFIGLYKALGGGWEQYQSLPSIHQPEPAIIAAFTRMLSSHRASEE